MALDEGVDDVGHQGEVAKGGDAGGVLVPRAALVACDPRHLSLDVLRLIKEKLIAFA